MTVYVKTKRLQVAYDFFRYRKWAQILLLHSKLICFDDCERERENTVCLKQNIDANFFQRSRSNETNERSQFSVVLMSLFNNYLSRFESVAYPAELFSSLDSLCVRAYNRESIEPRMRRMSCTEYVSF